MTRDVLQERERGIEAQWARKRDEELIEKLRERAKLDEIARLLARKLRLDDPDLRRRLLLLGLTHETGPALFLAPLVAVAWADGKISDREKDAILEMAAARGVEPATPVHDQVLEWLLRPPPKGLVDAALEVLRAGISVLPDAERAQRVEAYAASFRRVAEASGGGLGRVVGLASGISAEEEALIERMVAILRT